MENDLATATYHKRKLYIPKEIEERLLLQDGEVAEISIVDERSFRVSLKRRTTNSIEKRIIERIINRPFSAKMSREHLKREDFYDEN